jgi:hypothetical protein
LILEFPTSPVHPVHPVHPSSIQHERHRPCRFIFSNTAVSHLTFSGTWQSLPIFWVSYADCSQYYSSIHQQVSLFTNLSLYKYIVKPTKSVLSMYILPCLILSNTRHILIYYIVSVCVECTYVCTMVTTAALWQLLLIM